MSKHQFSRTYVDPCPLASTGLPHFPLSPFGITPENMDAVVNSFSNATEEVFRRLQSAHRKEAFRPVGYPYKLAHNNWANNRWAKGAIVELWRSSTGRPQEGVLCLNSDLGHLELDIESGVEDTLTGPSDGNGNSLTVRSRRVPIASEAYRAAVQLDPRIGREDLHFTVNGETWATIYEVSGIPDLLRVSIVSTQEAAERSRNPLYYRISDGLYYKRGFPGHFDLEIGAGTNGMIAFPGIGNCQPSVVLFRTVPTDGHAYNEAITRDRSLADTELMFDVNGTRCATIYNVCGDASVFRIGVLSPEDAASTFDIVEHLARGDSRSIPASRATVRPLLNRLTSVRMQSLMRRLTPYGSYDCGHPAFWFLELRETHERGTTIQKVDASTSDFGPLYNRRDKRGYLIPNSIEKNLEDPAERGKGFGVFLGLRGLVSGHIDFRFDAVSAGASPLLFPEDVDTVLALAFGSNTPAPPSFSLDRRVNQKGTVHPLKTMACKDFSPEWLEHTLFGKTLYATDYWIGKIATQPKHFLNQTPPFAPRDEATNLMLTRLSQIVTTDGCLRIVPRALVAAWESSTDNQPQCRVRTASMYVYGWRNHAAGKDGPEVIGANDHSTQIGRVGTFLTQHYDELARSWPIFERLRQLSTLWHCTLELRRRGFSPDKALIARASSRAQQEQANRPSDPTDRLVRWNHYPDL